MHVMCCAENITITNIHTPPTHLARRKGLYNILLSPIFLSFFLLKKELQASLLACWIAFFKEVSWNLILTSVKFEAKPCNIHLSQEPQRGKKREREEEKLFSMIYVLTVRRFSSLAKKEIIFLHLFFDSWEKETLLKMRNKHKNVF